MRKHTKTVDAITIIVLVLLIGWAVLASVLPRTKPENKTDVPVTNVAEERTTLKDYANKKIGIKTGTVFDKMVQDFLPEAQTSYFSNTTDLLTALTAGTIDAFATDEPTIKYAMRENSAITYLNEYMNEYDFGFAFPKTEKGEKLRTEFNTFLKKIKDDGTYQAIDDLWFGTDEAKQTIPELSTLSAENGTLSMATESAFAPFEFVKDNRIVGSEIDMAYRFCKEYGYGLEITDMIFDAIIPAVQSGKNDFGVAGMSITEERKESVYFSDSTYHGGCVLAVRKADVKNGGAAAVTNDKPWTAYSEKKIGIQTGTTFDKMVQGLIPTADISYFNSYTDLLMALTSGTIDAFAADEPIMKYAMRENSDVTYLDDYLDEYDFGFAFPKTEKGEKLRTEFNTFLKKIKEDGTYKAIDDLWFGTDEAKQTIPELSTLSAENGTLNMAAESANAPFVFMKDNRIVGSEIDIAYRFCKEYGYGLEITDMSFDAIIPAVQSGRNDFAASTITITEERKESVNFSDSTYHGGSVLAVRKADVKNGGAAAVTNDKPWTAFNGKRLGIRTGSAYEAVTLEKFPDSEYLYYESESDLIIALQSNKIDGFIDDEPVAAIVHAENSDVDYFKEPVVSDNYCFGFQKNTERSNKLRTEFNTMLAELKASGALQKLKEKWTGSDESVKTIEDYTFSGENGKIVVGSLTDNMPFCYVVDNQITGYGIELAKLFAYKYGYSVQFEQASVTACLGGLTSGKYDLFAGSLSYSEERAQSIDFSDAFYNGGMVLVARAADLGVQSEKSWTEYDGKRIGIKSGSSFEKISFEKFPSSAYSYYDTESDLTIALQSNKIDGFLIDEPAAAMILNQKNDVDYLKTPVVKDDYHFGFQKNTERSNKLRGEFNTMLAELKSSGELEKIKEKWTGSDENAKTFDDSELSGENGTIIVAVTGNGAPFSYVSNNKMIGFSVELAMRFARKYGYSIQLETANLAACLAGLTSGKYDILAGSLSYTEERAQSIDYSDAIYNGGMMLMVRKSDLIAADNTAADTTAEESGGFFADLKESFEKNFIREDRWKLIVSGIGTTCFITLMSAIAGTVLAFLICMYRRTGSKLANIISNLFVKLMQGTPIVVLLMILYYVVFSKIEKPVWVAVIGFGLNFAAYVSEIMRSGIESIDGGQREAALALGYSENQAFFRFIFPQAAKRFLPVYNGEIISLLKSTSVVGYIAIQDLTKMSDIIRSRTYEAFFPLIVTAVIYFILAWIISLVLKQVMRVLDPRSKKRGAAK